MATPAQEMLAAVRMGSATSVAAHLERDPQLADLADRGPGRFSVLHIAAYRGHLAVVEVLLAAGASVNRWSHEGTTPLFEAALGGHLEVARVLIAAGAETRVSDNGGHTLYSAARVGGNRELMELLKQYPLACGAMTQARGYINGRRRVT
jgi:ankyrin repeat protein